MGNGTHITKETLLAAARSNDQETLWGLLYDMFDGLYEQDRSHCANCQAQVAACNERFGRLENRRLMDRASASGMGLLGGFVAYLFHGLLFLR